MGKQSPQSSNASLRLRLLRAYLQLICYRYRRYIEPLQIPAGYPKGEHVYIDKARASLTTVGVFFAFAIAILAGMTASDKLRDQFANSSKGLDTWGLQAATKWAAIFLAVILPFLLIWTERQVGRLRRENSGAGWAYFRLASFGICATFLFGVAPLIWPTAQVRDVINFSFRDVFVLAGAALIVVAILLLFIALEFYDTASGWRGSSEVHFHGERIGSHSYVLGVSLALVGLFLLVTLVSDRLGPILALISLIVIIYVVEMERLLARSD